MHADNIGTQFWRRTETDRTVHGTRVLHTVGAVGDPVGAEELKDRERWAPHHEHEAPRESMYASMERTLDSFRSPVSRRHQYHPTDAERGSGPGGEDPMFGAHPASPWKVWGLFSHDNMTAHVGTALAALHRHSMATSGEPPEADTDLSDHSKRIVDRFVKAKMIKDPLRVPNPFVAADGTFVGNGIQREEGGSWAHEERLGKKARDEQIPAQNAAVESATARSMIRASGGGKKAAPAPVPDTHAQHVLFTAQAVRKASKKSGRS